ncbi:hypothetical protein EVAR_76483_1 [Eumeta japonica]|uniref:Uncharacterized protein n=1 Tax=Eumeta variegata TaxID=151549 RepID=A0A4C1T5G5_EUMVA|nr:hypothetical protein EVAR_76483_1 [Eumeta japonica]
MKASELTNGGASTPAAAAVQVDDVIAVISTLDEYPVVVNGVDALLFATGARHICGVLLRGVLTIADYGQHQDAGDVKQQVHKQGLTASPQGLVEALTTVALRFYKWKF